MLEKEKTDFFLSSPFAVEIGAYFLTIVYSNHIK